MKARRNRLRTLLIGGAAVFALLVFEENLRGQLELQSYRKALIARGEKLTVTELAPSPSATTRSALDLQAATKELSALQKGGHGIVQGLSAMKMVGPGRAVATFRENRPDIWLSSEESEVTAPGWPELASEIAKGESALQRVRIALATPVEFAIERAPGIKFDDSPRIVNTAAAWLIADVINSLHDGNLARSGESLVALGELPKAFRQGRNLITQTISHGVSAISLGALWEALQADGWTDEQLAAIQRAFQFDEGFTSMLRALEYERAQLSVYFDGLRKSANGRALALRTRGVNFLAVATGEAEAPPKPSAALIWLRSHIWRVMWSSQDELRSLHAWEPLIEDARRLGVEKNWAASSLSHGRSLPTTTGIDAWRFQFSTVFNEAPALAVINSAVKLETQRALMVMAIALKRYSLEHSSPPGSLSELVPKYMERVPTDWFDGQFLRYRANGDGGFVLYSVGKNGKDDGGNPEPPKKDHFRSLMEGRDIVWPTAVTEAR
jgi:hypothetical protein